MDAENAINLKEFPDGVMKKRALGLEGEILHLEQCN